ncbi:hypothetical protein KO528_15725 [Saccharophagus degradans]|uniref:Peptidase S1 and S6, chymotrypsin/Hap n=1 Tax=Saccharophagus degradans TaxID=86304 RepID=A0AAW7XAZ0_9GAMM|nr:hypothetical protein [Saccharophagus degradans]MBU2986814.1 hypothetical protein [Saccharophagus degradans]MDO6424833.1 hypothetical protein [Saccharophagus degradans]MDO6606621.1 hypothetical protein [Saccharophagus degradans]
MQSQLESLIPIFLDSELNRFSLIGTGVLIEFRGEVFIVTAGHVIDALEVGYLMVPRLDGKIDGIKGVYSYLKRDRASDYLDIGYFKLDKNYASELKAIFYAIPENEFGIKPIYSSKEFMSFGGFPYRKQNVAGGVATTKEYIFGAYHADSVEYYELACNPEDNIVAKYNRKKAVNPHNGKIQVSVLPHGISGGGIFIWPANTDQIIPSNRKLIGIGHTYKERGGYFIGTRLEVILGAILKNNPQLAVPT